VLSALDFIFLSLIYGTAFAAVAEGMKYFSPCGIIFLRMFFGFIVSLIILFIRVAFTKGYWQIVKAHFTSGIKYILWTSLGGLFYHGLPHCTIAIAQQWVSSAAVQIAQPLATAFGAILSHFVLPDEPFTCQKAIVLVLSITGVALSAIPSFIGAGGGSGGIEKIAIGYALLILAVSFFGFSPVIIKWKTPNADASASAVIQIAASTIVTFIIELFWDGPKELLRQIKEAPPIAWLWPFLVGCLGTGFAATGFNYLVACWGAAGANLIPFGQIVVGVAVGVIFLNEWGMYKVWEIVISCVGIGLLIVAIILGFYEKKPEIHDEEAIELRPKEEEEEEILDAPHVLEL
jgi:drug/metabolite transporter (DMT)-like permease